MKEKAATNENNLRSMNYIKMLRESGLSFEKIAIQLNGEGFRTARGKEFKKMTVKRLFERVIA